MTLRLPIDHKADVWGFSICLCELHCQRNAWRSEVDTAEVILAQGLGLANQQDGIPLAMIKRSGLDIRLLYTPQPKHFPLRRSVMGMLEVLRPQNWGLEQVLGDNWRTEKGDLGELLEKALVIDPMERPSASELLEMKFCQRVADSNEVETAPPEETQEPLQKELVGQAEESPVHLV
jgi:serine/threonine protein kinase